MGKFDNGILTYTFAEVTIQVAFPEDEVKCKWCRFLRHYDGLNRNKCSLTEEILPTIELIGLNCPLTIINTVMTEDLKK